MRVTQEIRDWTQFACDSCGCPELAAKIQIKFNNRFTRRMGDASACGGRYVVRLSAPLWPRATKEQQRETVIHEACHIIDSYLHGQMNGHQRPWKMLMIRCGLQPERCHTVNRDGIARKSKTVSVYCHCGTKQIGQIRARKMRQGVSQYRCTTCRDIISFTPTIQTAR